MNGDVETEGPRPRPLSAGIWTLFSWLRRTERSSSDESITSVGSDRTVASFDFLAPFHYKNANPPLVLQQSPLTETYKKRLQERNLRRQHDRDLTLRRKYGLYTEEGLGYDAFSLPPARKISKDSAGIQGRQRRATSESVIQPRAAYVPGKRRAPLPPTVVISNSLPRYHKRKRPAPKPPVKLTESNKENVNIYEESQMNSKQVLDKKSSDSKIVADLTECRVDKPEKKDHASKEVKLRSEKSFLKQIFDNRKRNSAIDTSHIKVLPSISELDKQAAEIILTNKSQHTEPGSLTEGSWICTNCLRKYNATIISCVYCDNGRTYDKIKGDRIVSPTASNMFTQTENKLSGSNTNNENEEKKKLRDMLKEMKDSLPKRPKNYQKRYSENYSTIVPSTETPTLRIGATMKEEKNSHIISPTQNKLKNARETFFTPQASSSKQIPHDIKYSSKKETNKIIQNEFKLTINSANNDKPQTFSSNFFPNSNLNRNSSYSASKDAPINAALDNKKKSLLINEFKPISENKRQKVTTEEIKLNLNTVSCELLRSNCTMLNSEDQRASTSTSENKQSAPMRDLKILSKTINQNVQKSNEVCEKNQHIQEKGASKNYPITTPLEIKGNFKQKLIGKPYELLPIKENEVIAENSDKYTKKKIENLQLDGLISPNAVQKNEVKTNIASKISNNTDLHTPLKISSLLNPLYCPKNNKSDGYKKFSDNNSIKTTEIKNEVDSKAKLLLNTTNQEHQVQVPIVIPSTSSAYFKKDILKSKDIPNEKYKEKLVVDSPTLNANSNLVTSCDNNLDQHARRRDLINQLEQSIANGDEQTAAEAAAKLAKLKLSCSVLSFSSQIVNVPLVSCVPPVSSKTIENVKENSENVIQEKQRQTVVKPISSISGKMDIKKLLPQQDIPVKTISNTSAKIDIKEPLQPHDKPETSKIINKVSGDENKATEGQKLTNEKKYTADSAIASTSKQISDQMIPIDVWIEDRDTTRGPIRLVVARKAILGELKRQAEKSFGLQIRLQRWIIGKTLCSNNDTPLITLAGPDFTAPFYLCLVEDTNKDELMKTEIEKNISSKEDKKIDPSDVYKDLMRLEKQALVPNSEEFECGVCIEKCAIGEGVVLRECIHSFCRECLADVVRHCEEPIASCPAIACSGALQEREIRALLTPEDYEKWLGRSLTAVESGTRNTFHCRTRDCAGWAFCEPGVRRFPCPVCKHTNCVPCQAVHDGQTCEQYQAKLREAVTAAESDHTDVGTQTLLKSLIDRGEALECPECKAIITKKWGCDWIKCSACKTEICWVTKGRRWGPGGKGDTSGGCRCGIDGKRCHPSCGYCH